MQIYNNLKIIDKRINYIITPRKWAIMKINIDKEIDAHRCPGLFFCTVATTGYDTWERENHCYKCWLTYCKEHNIEIIYD